MLRSPSSSSTRTSGASCRISEPERRDKPELSDAAAHSGAGGGPARRLFEQSVEAEKTRDDALTRRFEEALRQANDEPITRPLRDFDLD